MVLVESSYSDSRVSHDQAIALLGATPAVQNFTNYWI